MKNCEYYAEEKANTLDRHLIVISTLRYGWQNVNFFNYVPIIKLPHTIVLLKPNC